jgi:hypothetical protein
MHHLCIADAALPDLPISLNLKTRGGGREQTTGSNHNMGNVKAFAIFALKVAAVLALVNRVPKLKSAVYG